jgi:hypothetical protein
VSADNYYRVSRAGSKFAVTMGFASDDEEVQAGSRSVIFDTLQEAVSYAQSEYAEYGYHIDPDCWDNA